MYTLTGISSDIDSCARMIGQKAQHTYKRLRASDKRWLDFEDVAQEGLVTALRAEETHRSGEGQKFSTHLFRALDWSLGHLRSSLYTGMRTAPLVELDAIQDVDSMRVYADSQAQIVMRESGIGVPDGVKTFQALVGAVQAGPVEFQAVTIEHLVTVFLFGRYRKVVPETTPAIHEVLKSAVVKASICYNDLQEVVASSEIKKLLLRWAAVAAIMESERENKLRYLVCVNCDARFTLADVRNNRYFLDPSMCRGCYQEMGNDPNSCFGKTNSDTGQGYSEEDVECRLHCPDRQVCRAVVRSSMKTKTAKGAGVADLVDELKQLDLPGVELTPKSAEPVKDVKPKPVSKKAAKKAAKKEAVKPVKAAKPVVKKAAKKAAKPVKVAKKGTFAEPDAAELAVLRKAARSKAVATKAAKAPKPEKPVAKKAAKPKPVEDDELQAPKEVGGVWPWRRKSALRVCFINAFQGITLKKFDSLFEKGGELYRCGKRDWMLKQLRSGAAGKHEKTHTWELSEDGGRLQIHNVKYLMKKRDAERKEAERATEAEAAPAKPKKEKKVRRAAAPVKSKKVAAA